MDFGDVRSLVHATPVDYDAVARATWWSRNDVRIYIQQQLEARGEWEAYCQHMQGKYLSPEVLARESLEFTRQLYQFHRIVVGLDIWPDPPYVSASYTSGGEKLRIEVRVCDIVFVREERVTFLDHKKQLWFEFDLMHRHLDRYFSARRNAL